MCVPQFGVLGSLSQGHCLSWHSLVGALNFMFFPSPLSPVEGKMTQEVLPYQEKAVKETL